MGFYATRFLTDGKNDSPCTGEPYPLQSPIQLRMGGRVVDRARLESVFTLIGNEGSNPSPSGLLTHPSFTPILFWGGLFTGFGKNRAKLR